MLQRPLGVPQVMWWVVVSLAMSMVTVLQAIRVQVRRRVSGGAPGDAVGSAADREGVVGDAFGAGERLVGKRGR